MIKKLFGSAAVIALTMSFGATSAVASPISVVNADNSVTYGSLTCVLAGTDTDGCVGYYDGIFGDDDFAERFAGVGSSGDDESAYLNDLAGTSFTKDDAFKTELAGGPDNHSFKVSGDYFLIKIGGGSAFFKNIVGGGALDITWSAVSGTGSGLSHYTQFGDSPQFEVPEPGALALLGLGLVGFGIARRRRTSAA